MPAASALSENAIVLYTGTTGTYVSGQFYMCVNTGSGYEWQPVTISGTEEDTYTADRALMTNSLGQVTASGITVTELGYLSGATSPLQAQINGKVTAVSGMGLSQNSYTTDEKNKLAGIAAGAQVNVIEAVQRNGSAVPVSGKTVNISVPVALSELTNDKGFIDSTVENLANFYTKSEVNSLVSTIPKFAVQVVSSLPASGQSSTTIYLTPNSGSSGNVYDEYLWVNNAWEKIGSTQVSFTLDQDGNSIVINGTTLKDASSTSAGLMSITSYNDLQTAKSNISSLQSSYSTLNGTVSGLNSRLTTAESTLSTTVSRVSTCENSIIISGIATKDILTLNKQDGTGIDIPLDELSTVGYDLTVQVNATGSYSNEGITVQAVSDSYTYTGISNSEGIAHIYITENGVYSVSAQNVSYSSSENISVSLNSGISIDITDVVEVTANISLKLKSSNEVIYPNRTIQSGSESFGQASVSGSESTKTVSLTSSTADISIQGTALITGYSKYSVNWVESPTDYLVAISYVDILDNVTFNITGSITSYPSYAITFDGIGLVISVDGYMNCYNSTDLIYIHSSSGDLLRTEHIQAVASHSGEGNVIARYLVISNNPSARVRIPA